MNKSQQKKAQKPHSDSQAMYQTDGIKKLKHALPVPAVSHTRKP